MSQNFSWLSNLGLAILAKLKSQSVIGIIDKGSSGMKVTQNCVEWITFKEEGWIDYNTHYA